MLPRTVQLAVERAQPFLWLNDNHSSLSPHETMGPASSSNVEDAARRLDQFAPTLKVLFSDLSQSEGIIESPLFEVEGLKSALSTRRNPLGRWFIKADHALPVTGSIKARGAFYEVLVHAENLARIHGVCSHDEAAPALTSTKARALFAQHEIVVGSTGNLGLSVGAIATALGFHATVHMSREARDWKKRRLRADGVAVIEHDGDYGAAVAAGRAEAEANPASYFIDDEDSEHLFWGYSVAAVRLQRQLRDCGVRVDVDHPLFVYLPCGVGGAAGGITFGLRHLFGNHVHCFFAEPVASPCMLIRLASSDNRPMSVQDVGLDNRTEADGLAVAQASELAAHMVRSLVSGVFTVPDAHLFMDLYLLEQCEGHRVEPSAAAAVRGPVWILSAPSGEQYLQANNLHRALDAATHVIWTTGGALLPPDEYEGFHDRGRQLWMSDGGGSAERVR